MDVPEWLYRWAQLVKLAYAVLLVFLATVAPIAAVLGVGYVFLTDAGVLPKR